MKVAPAVLLLGVLAHVNPASGGTPVVNATQPARPPMEWGKSVAGLQLSLSQDQAVAVGSNFNVTLTVRNAGMVPADLGAAGAAFAWATVVYSRQNAWMTEKIPVSELEGNWQARLPAGRPLKLGTTDLARRGVYPYRLAKDVLKSYLGVRGAMELPSAQAALSRKLMPGMLRLRMSLLIVPPGAAPLVLKSNKLAVEVAPGSLESLSPADREAYVGRLLEKFNRDAWSGKAAHSVAVHLGKPVVPYLIRAVSQHGRPGHARMWMGTALADIRDERAAEALVRLLDDTAGGVRLVAAYHGPKQHSPELDKAIVRQSLRRNEPRMIGLAMLGFLAFRGQARQELLEASLEHEDPRIRSTATHVLSQRAGPDEVKSLALLLKDKNPRVRGAAARTLGAMGNHSPQVIGALVAALDLPGDYARFRICGALCGLTGKQLPYDRQASPDGRRKTIQAWKSWWAEENKSKPRRSKTP